MAIRLWQRTARTLDGRTLLGLLLAAQGCGFLWVFFGSGRRTTSYLLQEQVAPLWVYGLVLVVLGLAVIATQPYRRKGWARAVAVGVIGVGVYMGIMFALAGALTAALTNGVYVLAAWGEAAFVDE